MISFLIGLVLGVVVGALVFRNNAKKGEALVQKVEAEAKDALAKVKNK